MISSIQNETLCILTSILATQLPYLQILLALLCFPYLWIGSLSLFLILYIEHFYLSNFVDLTCGCFLGLMKWLSSAVKMVWCTSVKIQPVMGLHTPLSPALCGLKTGGSLELLPSSLVDVFWGREIWALNEGLKQRGAERDGSVVNSRGLDFVSQHPCSGPSQPTVTNSCSKEIWCLWPPWVSTHTHTHIAKNNFKKLYFCLLSRNDPVAWIWYWQIWYMYLFFFAWYQVWVDIVM